MWSGLAEPIGKYAWTGLVSQAGHHPGVRVRRRHRVSRLGQPGAAAAGRVDRDSRARGTDSVPPRVGAGRRARCTRAAPARGRVQPRTIPPQPGRGWADHGEGRDGRCGRRAGRARCANGAACGSRTGLVRRTGSSSTRTTRCASLPKARRTCFGVCGSRSRRSRRITAASRTRACGRCATWSMSVRSFAARIGQPIRTSTRASPPRLTRSSDRPTRPCSSRTITWPSSRRRCGPCGPTPAPHSSGTSRGPYPDRLRICPWRRELVAGLLANDLIAFQAGTRPPQLPHGRRRRTARRSGARVVARPLRRPCRPLWSRCRSGSTTTASSVLPPIQRSRRNNSACGPCSVCAPTSSGSASIASTTPRAFPSASMRSMRSWRGGRICGAD